MIIRIKVPTPKEDQIILLKVSSSTGLTMIQPVFKKPKAEKITDKID